MSIEWSKLVAQGRAKAFGVSWTEEEANAVFTLKIPADYVRQGILTLEEYEKSKGKVQIDTRGKEELMEKAKEEGIAVTPEATTESLKEVIAIAKKKREEEEIIALTERKLEEEEIAERKREEENEAKPSKKKRGRRKKGRGVASPKKFPIQP